MQLAEYCGWKQWNWYWMKIWFWGQVSDTRTLTEADVTESKSDKVQQTNTAASPSQTPVTTLETLMSVRCSPSMSSVCWGHTAGAPYVSPLLLHPHFHLRESRWIINCAMLLYIIFALANSYLQWCWLLCTISVKQVNETELWNYIENGKDIKFGNIYNLNFIFRVFRYSFEWPGK